MSVPEAFSSCGLHLLSPAGLITTTGPQDSSLGFGVPYFNTFFLKGTLMK